MLDKTMMVAAREYTENLRTKTFWLGILAFPMMLMIMAVVPALLRGAKDLRRYAVIDRSGWLLQAIDERGQYDDVYRLLEFLQEQARRGEATLRRMPDVLRPVAELVRDASAERLTSMAKLMANSSADLPREDGTPGQLEPQVREELSKHQTQMLAWLASLSPDQARRLKAGIKRGDYARIEVPPDVADPERYLTDLLGGGDGLFAYFVIGPDPIHGSGGCKYVSNNRTDTDLREWMENLASEAVQAERFARESINADVARRIQEPLIFEERQLSPAGVESEVSSQDTTRQWAPLVFVYLLWISIFTIAQLLLTNTIEEKSNRIIEVLLSSISPLQLMAGKIIGIAATGLTTIAAWVVFFLVALKFLPEVLDLPADVDLTILVGDPTFLASFVLYFLLGFLFYASILVAIGSACNSIKEAQNLMAPIMILLSLPLLAMLPVGKDPNGTLAVALSFIPPFTPFVMMNRAAGPPELWEYVATTVLLLISVAIAFWAAARVFRVGILMTGNPPKIAEIWRWIWSRD
jgi:ABC-2 type transport system permease protein